MKGWSVLLIILLLCIFLYLWAIMPRMLHKPDMKPLNSGYMHTEDYMITNQMPRKIP